MQLFQTMHVRTVFFWKGREKYNTCGLERKDHGSDDKLIMLNTFQ